jgi:hypothetical protein
MEPRRALGHVHCHAKMTAGARRDADDWSQDTPTLPRSRDLLRCPSWVEVTKYSGDMGDTSPLRRGHALEGVSCHGRAPGKTGYKIFDRYKDYGVYRLTDRSRRPYRHANQLPLVIETQIVRLKKE